MANGHLSISYFTTSTRTLQATFTCLILILCFTTHGANARNDFYLNEWAVEIQGGNDAAEQVASTHGFINHGLIMEGEDFYRFSHPKLRKRSLESSYDHNANLMSHEKVLWAEQQRSKRRVKRDLINFDPNVGPNDEKWHEMWYLLPTTVPSMRVTEAWKEGFTGKGVSVTILDDGIEHSHPDLHANYDPLASGDINSHDDDPTPRLNPTNENRHGTRCAGEVAAVANNGICAVGIAFNSKIGGVRMLDGEVTDTVEAASIGLRPEHIDIYSASWGPDDDGKTVDGPATLAKRAFVRGVNEGRDGKGSIFVWASGNGGRHQDNCNCDGYTDSIYTLSISSTTQRGTRPWYSEACSSTLAATYSSGRSGDKQIVTTDLRHGCTNTHTGTSASAPLAAGICALALEANSNLTWRDMQHLVVRTANSDKLIVDDWQTNGVGRKVSHAFGYGLMDAYAMVVQARNWTNVPVQRRCNISVISPQETPRMLSLTEPLIVPVEVMGCENGEMVDRLEHVQAELTLRNGRRGDLSITLTSPAGTVSQLLEPRRNDLTGHGFNNWAFMTTHSWDENPHGRWVLEIRDRNERQVSGTLSVFNLILYGTAASDWPQPSTTTTSTTMTTSTPAHAREGVSSTTTISTTTITPIPLVEGLKNCKVSRPSGTKCLVCERDWFLDPVDGLCVSACPPGHYEAPEHVDVHVPRDTDSNDPTEGLVCRPCASLCYRCMGPKTTECVQCVAEAEMRTDDQACVNKENKPLKTVKRSLSNYILPIIALLAVVVSVVILLVCRPSGSSSKCFTANQVQYKYLSSGEGSLRSLDEYHDDDDDDDVVPAIETRINDPSTNPARNGYSKTHLGNGYAKINNVH